ncbi:MAG: EamA/RhaT family transporter [Flavobacteriales bacterium]|nr:EamA/RhaT family transporter [Flavobacteriales bacterium]
MIWLLLSVLSSTVIFLLFRMFPKMGVITFPAIVVNYLVAAMCGIVMAGNEYSITDKLEEPWLIGGLSYGVLFISLFYLMAYTSQKIGMSAASVATKMSLVIPVAWFMITDVNDEVTLIKVLAVVLAIFGVLFASRRKDEKFNWNLLLFPIIIFVGSGIIDLVIGHFSHGTALSTQENKYLFTSAPFVTSSFIGGVVLIIRKSKGLPVFNSKTIIAGAVLGAVNFGSIYFLVRTIDAHLLDRSAIIPINNLGVVVFSAIAAIIAFRETFSRINILGLALSISAILLLVFGA